LNGLISDRLNGLGKTVGARKLSGLGRLLLLAALALLRQLGVLATDDRIDLALEGLWLLLIGRSLALGRGGCLKK
jgi:hypothetical protein